MYPTTTEQIKQHRKARKDSGLVGCMNGADTPMHSLKGISWRPQDPTSPSCFCHDCRTMWDSEGSIDLDLIKQGNARACFTYKSLLPSKKEILQELRCKTDDALEDFIKVQMQSFQNMVTETELYEAARALSSARLTEREFLDANF